MVMGLGNRKRENRKTENRKWKNGMNNKKTGIVDDSGFV